MFIKKKTAQIYQNSKVINEPFHLYSGGCQSAFRFQCLLNFRTSRKARSLKGIEACNQHLREHTSQVFTTVGSI